MLDTHLLARIAEQLVEPARTIACRVDTGSGAQGLRAHHTIAKLQTAAVQPRCRRRHTDPDDDDVGVDELAVAQPTPVVRPSSPSIPTTSTSHSTSTPWRACTLATISPISAPSPRINGAGAPSRTVTAQPVSAAVAATSRPMKPAPITTTRGRSARRRRNASESSSVRNIVTPSRSG